MRFYGRSWAVLVLFATIWLAQTPAIAGTQPCTNGLSGNLHHLVGDLDADHKSDSISFRYSGTRHSIEVRFSSNRQRVHLAVPFGGKTGFQLFAYDVDHDRRDDLVLTADSSIVPVALWLNKGNGSFVRKSGTLAPLFSSGFGARVQRGRARGDSPAAISTDASPKAIQIDQNTCCHLESFAWSGHTDDPRRKSRVQFFFSSRGPPHLTI